MRRYHYIHNPSGFTLVELVLVIVIVGILAAMGTSFITRPVEGYVALARRSELVDAAENALRRMQRDIRQALPNSLRVKVVTNTNGEEVTYLEILHTIDGGRYRAYTGDPSDPGDILDFDGADTSFDVLGKLRAAPTNNQAIVIYNLTSSGTEGNAYAGDNRTNVAAGSKTTSVNLPGFRFPRSSPYQRFFIVDGPVTYACDPNAGTLTRHWGYNIAAAQPTPPAPAAGSSALMADHVSGCSLTYAPGSSQRAGLLTLELALTDAGETVNLLHQVHVDNSP